MDIFVIDAKSSKKVSENLLSKFQKKPINNHEKWRTHCYCYLMTDRILENIYDIKKREIIYENNRKPVLKSGKKHFSISHSYKYIALAFSDNVCGVDIEYIKNRDYEAISKRMNFNSKTQEEFYEDWTSYEAKYKLQCENKSIKVFKFEDYVLTAVSDNPDEEYDMYFQTLD